MTLRAHIAAGAAATLLLACVATTAAAHDTSFTVAGKEFAFEPARIEAHVGEPVEITFENAGALSHNLTIEGLDAGTETIQSGNTQTIRVTPEEPGEYRFECTVPGHAEAGMTGTLVVTQ